MEIGTLLVANRGEIACRVIRTAREMGIRTVAIFSEPDRGAPHVALADRAFALPGCSAAETYLDHKKVLDAARRTGADALHPGYGFLSESADFALSCAEAGVLFVGPSVEALREMGLKHRAKDLARTAGLPTLPDALLDGDDPGAWRAAAAAVGYPLLVKATAGGGGRGMRRVDGPEELTAAISGAGREALSSFGDGRVFLERLLPAARHVEIQVFGDRQGTVVHLLERECSVQRRHQKVVEETPSPALTPAVRARMGAGAVALARTLGYVGAGTVEFLVEGEGDEAEFSFLEMNTRLQVEHPVTEAVIGLDLVRLQLEVARGDPLPFNQDDVAAVGHAVEVRLYAEDPAAGFTPTFGRLWRYDHGARPFPGVRYDEGVASGSEVSTFYDPMLAKVVAHAPTRREACARLAGALAAMRLYGPDTNRDFLVRILRHPDFLAGATDIDFIDRHPELFDAACDDDTVAAHLAAAVVAGADRRRAVSVVNFAPPGWRLFPGPGQRATWVRRGGDEYPIEYQVDGTVIALTIAGHSRHLEFEVAADRTAVAVTAGQIRRDCSVYHAPDGTVWVHDGEVQTCWVEQDRLPAPAAGTVAGAPVAEMPGTIVAVLVKPGDTVAAGDPLVILEAMKMEHRVIAPSAGVVGDVRVSVGQRVDAHQVLVVLEPPDVEN